MRRLKVKIALMEQGSSQYELASFLGCDPSVVSRIVNGWVTPGEELKTKIAQFLNKTVKDLFDESKGHIHDGGSYSE